MKNLIDRDKVLGLLYELESNRQKGERLNYETLLTILKMRIENMPLEAPQEDKQQDNKLHYWFIVNGRVLRGMIKRSEQGKYPDIYPINEVDENSNFVSGTYAIRKQHIFLTKEDAEKLLMSWDVSLDLPDKRCGTCVSFPLVDDCGCQLGHFIYRCKSKELITSDRLEMKSTDGTNCPDWRGKPKEQMRVWTCDKCGEDIRLIHDGYTYIHCKTDSSICHPRGISFAIPKPDSERWVDK